MQIWMSDKMGNISVELAPSETDEVRRLISELDQTLAANYRPEERHGVPLDALFQPHIRFFLARLDGAAVGCGGVAFFPGFAEVKRMYVRDIARRRGVAQAMLNRIEAEVHEAGVAVLRLETGTHQEAAIQLYLRAGFQRCAAFGEYADMAPAAIGTSVFFEKRLGTSGSIQT
jgi:putative acetyltransferase